MLEEYRVAAGRLGEAVDLLLERDDLVAGLAQSGDQSLILGRHGSQVGLEAGESALERSCPLVVE
ncbi:unannotated protein [freshwater metagenome]|uniref:Unannotated protein n=1 Tax=freshwater metagenome TaxID=449393 RepID=A0A6J7JDQ0_9ZZZZ